METFLPIYSSKNTLAFSLVCLCLKKCGGCIHFEIVGREKIDQVQNSVLNVVEVSVRPEEVGSAVATPAREREGLAARVTDVLQC